jgi:hypothetical protein
VKDTLSLGRSSSPKRLQRFFDNIRPNQTRTLYWRAPPLLPRPISPESNLASSPTNNKDRPSQSKTAAELAKMIEADLGCHPDCPKAGFRITVYGWPNWRAMLTIGPAAGPVRDPQRWRDLTDELAERLRNRYDLAWGE